jgi:hypothetical protein
MCDSGGTWLFQVRFGQSWVTNILPGRVAVERHIAERMADTDYQWKEIQRDDCVIVLQNGRKRSEQITYWAER